LSNRIIPKERAATLLKLELATLAGGRPVNASRSASAQCPLAITHARLHCEVPEKQLRSLLTRKVQRGGQRSDEQTLNGTKEDMSAEPRYRQVGVEAPAIPVLPSVRARPQPYEKCCCLIPARRLLKQPFPD